MARKGRRAANEERLIAVQMHENGMSADQIAEVMNVGRSSVFGWIDKYRKGGLAAISTEVASGRPTTLDDSEMVCLYTMINGKDPRVHVTIYRWVQRFTALLIDAPRPCQHAAGDRWFVEETSGKLTGRWRCGYRAIDQFGQVIDVLVSEKRDGAATRRFFTRALGQAPRPADVRTDRAQAYPRALGELLPGACPVLENYANNPIESDHGRLKSRLRPRRGLTQLRCAHVISAGHAFIQDIRRSHDELGVEKPPTLRVAAAVTELALAI